MERYIIKNKQKMNYKLIFWVTNKNRAAASHEWILVFNGYEPCKCGSGHGSPPLLVFHLPGVNELWNGGLVSEAKKNPPVCYNIFLNGHFSGGMACLHPIRSKFFWDSDSSLQQPFLSPVISWFLCIISSSSQIISPLLLLMLLLEVLHGCISKLSWKSPIVL